MLPAALLIFKIFLKGDFQLVGSNRIEFLCHFLFLFLFLLLDFIMRHVIYFGVTIKCIHAEIYITS